MIPRAISHAALAVLAATLLALPGCRSPVDDVPPGYQDDTTPTHDGEDWRGGESRAPGAADAPEIVPIVEVRL